MVLVRQQRSGIRKHMAEAKQGMALAHRVRQDGHRLGEYTRRHVVLF